MKLPITVAREGMLRGARFTARIGEWREDAPTKPKAEEALAALIERLVSEDGTPVVKYDARGQAWVAQRDNGGTWSYYMLEPGTGNRRCVCMTGNGGRARCIEAMLSHMVQWCEVNPA